MPNFTAGTSFTDGVTNDVTAAKLNALIADAVPTSSLSLNSTTGTIANLSSSTANITNGTITNLTNGTTTATAEVITSGTIQSLTSSTANITSGTFGGSINSTTGTIGNLSTTLAGDLTISQGTATLATSGVTASSYGTTSDIPRITVDAKGRITSASTVTAPVGFRNRIINGDMRIDQRNAGASVTPSGSGSNFYFLDRWNYTPSQSSKVTLQQSTAVPAGFFNSLYASVASAVTPGASDYFGISQFIEGNNVSDLDYGKSTARTTTLSFWVQSSVTGTYSIQIQNSAQNRSYIATYTVNSANTWEQKSVTILGCTDGTWLTGTGKSIAIWFDLGSGSNFNGTAGQWNTSNTIRTVGSVNWISNAGATFYITGVQLEAGSTATDFERRPYGTELALCQRYYETSVFDARTAAYAAGSFVISIPMVVEKRATTGTPAFTAAASASNNISGTPTVLLVSNKVIRGTFLSAAAGDTYYVRNVEIPAEL